MTWSAPSALAFAALASSPTVVMTVQPIAFAILMATEPMPEPPACTRMVSPGLSLALSKSMCSVVPKAIGAQAASRSATRAGTDYQRQRALGEGHAAKAPQVEVSERDRLDADLHLAIAGRRRGRHVDKFKLAIGDKS